MISGNKPRTRRGSRVLQNGRIVSRDGTTVIDVKIREISATGAILRIPPNVNFPENFYLQVVADGMRYPAEKRWRKGERLVVKFVREPRSTGPRKGSTAI
jgi:transcriptional regulator of acetoin/glycerol metabolism